MSFKQSIKNLIGFKKWRLVKNLLGQTNVEEVEIAYKILKNFNSSKVMIDVGAHFGTSLEPFAEDGWSIYAFEPDIENRSKLINTCKKYNNVKIDTRAVSNKDKEILSFYTSKISSGISSLGSFHDTHEETAKVETVTLQTYLNDNNIEEIAFLKIDTEGHDLFVLEGINWDTHKPDIIVCEFENRKTEPLGYSFDDLANYLFKKGYQLVVSEWYPMLEYGQKHKWRKFGEYPYNLADDKGWGNIIAVKNNILKKELDSITKLLSKKYS